MRPSEGQSRFRFLDFLAVSITKSIGSNFVLNRDKVALEEDVSVGPECICDAFVTLVLFGLLGVTEGCVSGFVFSSDEATIRTCVRRSAFAFRLSRSNLWQCIRPCYI